MSVGLFYFTFPTGGVDDCVHADETAGRRVRCIAAMPCEGGLICGAHGSYGMTGAVRL